ncbi:MAG: redoxin domain-containing protein [Verrucomicrobiota bacterium JB023]|nr:redoxin domain-containing protein [Verrucomicrobiota bacterium JB023]
MAQVQALQAAADDLSAQKINLLGVSMDPVPKQRAFADKFNITFPLLCDTSGEICDQFNVPHPADKPSRYSFLFHKQRLIWADQRVTPAKQAEHVLKAVKKHRIKERSGEMNG